jgi:hypothetical protein
MTTLFLIAKTTDAACAAQIGQDLTAQGYAVNTAADSAAGSQGWQSAMNLSDAVLLVWSAAAAQDAEVAAAINKARWLYKRLLVVAVDDTALPAELDGAPLLRSAAPCSDAVARLQAQLPLNAAADLPSEPAAQPVRNSEAAHVFGVRCKNGHVSYFDKRDVCRSNIRKRVVRNGKTLDELRLRCESCGEWIVVEVDCEGYR